MFGRLALLTCYSLFCKGRNGRLEATPDTLRKMAARTTYTDQEKRVGILDLNDDTRTAKGVINSMLKNMQRTGESQVESRIASLRLTADYLRGVVSLAIVSCVVLAVLASANINLLATGPQGTAPFRASPQWCSTYVARNLGWTYRAATQ
eukprot:717612-Pelagomonas_calceolata.AAC.1